MIGLRHYLLYFNIKAVAFCSHAARAVKRTVAKSWPEREVVLQSFICMRAMILSVGPVRESFGNAIEINHHWFQTAGFRGDPEMEPAKEPGGECSRA
jgi:hypothetical protein